MTAVPARVVDRTLSLIADQPSDRCWEWPLSIGSHGYGQIGWWSQGRSRMVLAHRVAYQALVGPIPAGMTVDHTCHNRICCNPAHLRLLTNAENARDNGFATRTHCPKGHEYTPENTGRGNPRRPGGRPSRVCLECRRLYNASRSR